MPRRRGLPVDGQLEVTEQPDVHHAPLVSEAAPGAPVRVVDVVRANGRLGCPGGGVWGRASRPHGGMAGEPAAAGCAINGASRGCHHTGRTACHPSSSATSHGRSDALEPVASASPSGTALTSPKRLCHAPNRAAEVRVDSTAGDARPIRCSLTRARSPPSVCAPAITGLRSLSPHAAAAATMSAATVPRPSVSRASLWTAEGLSGGASAEPAARAGTGTSQGRSDRGTRPVDQHEQRWARTPGPSRGHACEDVRRPAPPAVLEHDHGRSIGCPSDGGDHGIELGHVTSQPVRQREGGRRVPPPHRLREGMAEQRRVA
jgi:hypothetical protein